MNTEPSTTVVSYIVNITTKRSLSGILTVSTPYNNNVSKSTKSSSFTTTDLSDTLTHLKGVKINLDSYTLTSSFSLTTIKRIFTKFARRVYRSFSMSARRVKRIITLEKWQ